MSIRDMLREGEWLGDYEIRSRLRAGGMATLFLAQRHGAAGVSRPVVIKVIHPHLADDELMVRMFIDEARISSHISHSNVVYVEKFGEHDGIYYMVMEYVDGCSLQQLLRACAAGGRMLSVAIAVHLAIEAAAGLHAAHETTGDDGAPLGIVHRDVSPSNVLLSRDGRVKLIDFGIAKARDRLGGTRGSSGLKGKLRYMSPDQAWGRPIDRRGDIYALGICLWELVTCRRLFRGKDLAVLELVRNPVIPPPSKFNPEISAALDAVVLRATAKRPEDRHQTALELRRDLMSAVPEAVAIPAELVGELVHHVYLQERAATVELTAATFDDMTESSLQDPEPSAGARVGGRRPHAWRSRGLVLAGVVGACALGIAIATAGRAHDAVRASVPPPHEARLPDAGIAARSALDASAAPAADPISASPASAPPPPEPPAAPRPGNADKTDVAAKTASGAKPARRPQPRVTTIEADGAVLANEPTSGSGSPTATPTQRPSNAVRADDAVLAR